MAEADRAGTGKGAAAAGPAAALPGRGSRLAGLAPYAYLLPAILVLGYVVAYPLVRALYESFLKLQLADVTAEGVAGLGNYAAIAHDAVFWRSLVVTVVFTAGTVGVSFLLGLWFALLVEALPPWATAVRGLLLAPWVQPAIVVGFLFLYVFDQDVGVVNLVLARVHLIGRALPWLASERLSLAAVTIANIWSQTPFFVLMFSASMAGIPGELREAMRIDGARPRQELRHLTIPFLRNVMVIASVLMVIRSFNNFPVIWTMTQGGPVYATTTLVVYIYRLAFEQFDVGYASAVGIVWLLVLLGFTALYVRLLRRESLT